VKFQRGSAGGFGGGEQIVEEPIGERWTIEKARPAHYRPPVEGKIDACGEDHEIPGSTLPDRATCVAPESVYGD
jgi:hypothetical protein